MKLTLIAMLLQQPKPVYHVSPKLDVPLLVGASLALILPYAYDDKLIKHRCPCDPSEVNSFDRPAIGNHSELARTLSDVTVTLAVTLPLALDALDIGVNRTWLDDAIVFGETMAVNSALVTAAKFIVQRPLPRTYAGDPNFINSPDGYRAFYSGHTSTTFAALAATAMTIRLRYGEKTWPWIITGVVGTSVAIERVADGRHFPTDVMVGAIMGTAVGIVVPWLHARNSAETQSLSAAPNGTRGVLIGWAVPF